ncbi:MAG TPA: asparagine synthase (glutamine-hydrolyzing), partial [Bacteroidia bacterium]|nr:asparagine synthase (glutamine-hydrolyzing) [Bacteroidia bacterium]
YANQMLHTTTHRGPDATDTWQQQHLILGHNRLSIIDLSTHANQPMHYAHATLVFNGEIYNYIELRNQLKQAGYSFTTQSDSEVILAAYLYWGHQCVNYFVGMWAFVLYDAKQHQLFIARDRFGIKPFNYILTNNRFYFSSEYKALKQMPVYNGAVNYTQALRGLQLGWLCYKDETYLQCIKSLPAAHYMILHLHQQLQPEIKCYWQIEPSKIIASFQDKVQMFKQAFADSIQLHMRSDVTVGSCLSGGIDSSAIVSMVQHLNKSMPYKSFSIYYDGKGDVDERPFINEVLHKYPAIEAYFKKPTDDEVAAHFHNALYHADVPATGSSFISQYFLMQLIASQKIKVVLDGQGSDEYLGGYMHTYYRLIADMLRKNEYSSAFSTTKQITNQFGFNFKQKAIHFAKSALCTIRTEQQLYEFEYKNYFPFLGRAIHDAPFQLDAHAGMDGFLINLIQTTSLPSLLHYEDRNSMAFSIESRVPFLDHRLVELAFSFQNDDKIQGLSTKHILREALRDVLPKAITERKDKKGFVTPGENKWLRGPLQHLLQIDYDVLSFLNVDKVKTIVNQYSKGDNSNAVLVWRIATLHYWLKHFVH